MEALELRLEGFGRYQAWLYGLLFFPCFFSGAVTLLFTFTAAVADHRCCVAAVDGAGCDEGPFRLSNDSLALYFPQGQGDEHSRCSVCADEACEVVERCSGVRFDRSVFGSSLVEELGLVCEGSWGLELAQSSWMLGVLLGAGVFGLASDRWGRRKVFALSAAVQMVSLNVTPWLATSFPLLLLLQLVNGAAQYGTFLCAFILIMESMQGFTRTICGIWVQGFFAFGYIFVGLVAYFVRDWRAIQWVTCVPGLLLLPIAYFVPESIRWSLVNGREAEAQRNLDRVVRYNRLEPVALAGEGAGAEETQATRAEGNVLDLLRHAALAKSTLIVFFTWFVCSMTYYGLSLNTGDLPGDVYVTFLLSGIVELPGYVLCVWGMERFGRRWTLVGLFGLGGVCCVGAGLVPRALGSGAVVVALAVTGKMCAAAAFAVTYNYSAEIFPTVVRNAGTGMASLCARFGSIAAPQIHLLAKVGPKWLPILIYGAFAVAAAALDLFLPETRGVPLPQTIQDGLLFHESQSKASLRQTKSKPALV